MLVLMNVTLQGDFLLLNVTDNLLFRLSRPFRMFFPPRHHYQRWIRCVRSGLGKPVDSHAPADLCNLQKFQHLLKQ